MDSKSLNTLEFPKVLQKLAAYTAFSASEALALSLHPMRGLDNVRRRLQETEEARRLLDATPELTIGGARDVRELLKIARRGAILTPTEILDVKNTLVASREVRRTLTRLEEHYPNLGLLAENLPEVTGIISTINRTIDERGEVLDSASPELASIRAELRVAHDRLVSRLNGIIQNPDNAEWLQDTLVLKRADRFVIPLRANFKGRIKGVVHDQSASGATLFIEPLSVVPLNNAWREQQLREQQEIQRILKEITKLIAVEADNIDYIVVGLAEIDLAFAKARYANATNATHPKVTGFEKDEAQTTRSHPGSSIKLNQARHPLLEPESVVPIDMVLDDKTYVLVITGPNTGGKTVSLKTAALAILMAQAGMHILAERGSEISLFKDVFADIGDEQSIEQSLSTFSSHITNISRILKRANRRSLVILDELGAGTDPGEGAALARALLNYLLDKGVTTLSTTHYPELKAYAHNTEGVINASVEFDLQTLAPTYRLLIGLPGRSNAIAIAERLGLDSTIIAESRSLIGTEAEKTDDLLEDILKQRDQARKERELAEAIRDDALALEHRLQQRLDNIAEERKAILADAQQEAHAQLNQAMADIRRIRSRAPSLPTQDAKKRQTEVKQLESELKALEAEIVQPVEADPTLEARPSQQEKRPLKLGDRVQIGSLKTEGVIIALTRTQAEVQVGMMRLKANLNELTRIKGPKDNEAEIAEQVKRLDRKSASPGPQLDIRGHRVEEGLEELERYLDQAVMAELQWVRIVHGKGTGRMRQAVREVLHHSGLVSSYEAGKQAEGGDGVTIARLRV